MKNIFLLIFIAISINGMSQIPSYVPQNGLVGWWPFNNNAIDESGNAYHGTVYGATMTMDRNGEQNKAYSFNGINNWIEFGNIINVAAQSAITISAWFKPSGFYNYSNTYTGLDIGKKTSGNMTLRVNEDYKFQCLYSEASPPGIHREYVIADDSYSVNNWYHLVAVFQNNKAQLYINGIEQTNATSSGGILSSIPSNSKLYAGKSFTDNDIEHFYVGSIDDIGIWNRALEPKEIIELYQSCALFVTQPTNQIVNLNSSVQFVVNSNNTNTTYQWQSNPCNYGWNNVPQNSTYIGGTTNTLEINHTQLANHLQPFRVIAMAGTCKDTSETATISILDTCLVTVYDTISVTDTLIINLGLSGLSSPSNNIIKVYPNPANDHITIDYGNFGEMNGYTLIISNSLGQLMFTTPVNQQTSYIDLNTWNGNGIYFVKLFDDQNSLVDVRKILIQ